MLKYKKINVNPKLRITGDSSTRALVSCLNISYKDALQLQVAAVLDSGYDFTSKRVMTSVLKTFGYTLIHQPRKVDKTKYMVKELDQVITEGQMENGVIVSANHNYTFVKSGEYLDIWNPGCRYVDHYYVKVR